MACSTTPLTQSQIQQAVQTAGFPATMAPLMSAIAMAESGGCATAVNPTDNGGKQTSWGLFQISDGTHRELPGWSSPQTNANMAFAKWKSQGLTAWGTYTSGAYKPFLNGANDASNPPGSTGTITPQGQAQIDASNSTFGGLFSGFQQSLGIFSEEVAVFVIAIFVIVIGALALFGKQIGAAIEGKSTGGNPKPVTETMK